MCGTSFFSYGDWFIGSAAITKGITEKDIKNTKLFNYNNIESLEKLFLEYPNQIACVILEPASTEHPKENFLHKVKELCHKNEAVFILDEMITGFRWHLKGAQHYYDIEPDLCTFGKA
ncbi:MAG: aminotransferase class III-fold pyridoxal phosphate-dependent enzyme, partial [Chitinophagales bacterium]|nr:aminotransferase class III-fold pyridoxal phosphate-dependent enzyme [Chitinophagales bacterium]